jgi:hypothetical protein
MRRLRPTDAAIDKLTAITAEPRLAHEKRILVRLLESVR